MSLPSKLLSADSGYYVIFRLIVVVLAEFDNNTVVKIALFISNVPRLVDVLITNYRLIRQQN